MTHLNIHTRPIMNATLFNDRRAAGLLNRVREDVSHLRDDLGTLLSHATRNTLPNSAKDLTEQAKHGLAAGGAYAVSRLRNMRKDTLAHHSAGWVGGALVLGLLAYGTYTIFRTEQPEAGLDIGADLPPQDEMI